MASDKALGSSSLCSSETLGERNLQQLRPTPSPNGDSKSKSPLGKCRLCENHRLFCPGCKVDLLFELGFSQLVLGCGYFLRCPICVDGDLCRTDHRVFLATYEDRSHVAKQRRYRQRWKQSEQIRYLYPSWTQAPAEHICVQCLTI